MLQRVMTRYKYVYGMHQQVKRLLFGIMNGPVYYAVFSPDGKYLATASYDYTALIWNVSTGNETHVLKHDDTVYSVVFSPDGKYVATASDDNTARIWDVSTGKQISVLNHDDLVINVVFSPDGKYVATASGYDSMYMGCINR